MDTIRPNETKSSPTLCTRHGAVHFDFLITLKNDSPLQGVHFFVSASDELGLSVNTTLGAEIFHALNQDHEQNWYGLMLAYAHTKIIKKFAGSPKFSQIKWGRLRLRSTHKD